MDHKPWILSAIIILVLSQLMCSLGSGIIPAVQMTAVAGEVEKTMGVLQKTVEGVQTSAPTLEIGLQNTVEAMQTHAPTLESGLQKTVEAMQTQPPDAVGLEKTAVQVLTQIVSQPTAAEKLGGISGKLSYPAEFVPPLTIVAYKENNDAMTGEKYLVDTSKSQMSYTIENVPAGQYFVVAYLRQGTLPGINGLAAGYTQYILCGATASCTDHTLVAVPVTDGTITPNINPQDWYAPANSFPSEPPK